MQSFILFFPPYVLVMCIRKFTFSYTGTTGWLQLSTTGWLQLSSFFSSCYTYAGSFRVIIVVIWQHLYCVHILYFAVVIMLFQV